jgi:hypothetical protein
MATVTEDRSRTRARVFMVEAPLDSAITM